jgi:hypothetical protein
MPYILLIIFILFIQTYIISEYLGYVLEELGVKLNETTVQIMDLLRLESDEYIMKSSSIAASKVAAVIAKIRNIR